MKKDKNLKSNKKSCKDCKITSCKGNCKDNSCKDKSCKDNSFELDHNSDNSFELK